MPPGFDSTLFASVLERPPVLKRRCAHVEFTSTSALGEQMLPVLHDLDRHSFARFNANGFDPATVVLASPSKY